MKTYIWKGTEQDLKNNGFIYSTTFDNWWKFDKKVYINVLWRGFYLDNKSNIIWEKGLVRFHRKLYKSTTHTDKVKYIQKYIDQGLIELKK